MVRKVELPIKCPFWLKNVLYALKAFFMALILLILKYMSSPKSHSKGISTSFAGGYKSIGNELAMLVLPRNAIALVQVLVTAMIDFLTFWQLTLLFNHFYYITCNLSKENGAF